MGTCLSASALSKSAMPSKQRLTCSSTSRSSKAPHTGLVRYGVDVPRLLTAVLTHARRCWRRVAPFPGGPRRVHRQGTRAAGCHGRHRRLLGQPGAAAAARGSLSRSCAAPAADRRSATARRPFLRAHPLQLLSNVCSGAELWLPATLAGGGVLRIVSLPGSESAKPRSCARPLSDLLEPHSNVPIPYSQLRQEASHADAPDRCPLRASAALCVPPADELERIAGRARRWHVYVQGALLVLMHQSGVCMPGSMSVLIHSAVPEGKGVSSSAALEVSVMSALAAALGISLEGRPLALLCQKVTLWSACLCVRLYFRNCH